VRRLSRAVAGLVVALSASPASPQDWVAEGERAVERAQRRTQLDRPAQNVVLMIGDGMSVTTVTAARILEGQLRGEDGEENELAFESLPFVALAKTYNTDQQVPDSAGTMTALVSGVKTRAGVIGLDQRAERGVFDTAGDHAVKTLLEQAEERGMATGVVTTSSVTHATPAACYAHVPERHWENDARLPLAAREADFPDIARQLLELPYGDGPEVVLGGGREHFLPHGSADPEHPAVRGSRLDGRDLTREWTEARPGAHYVWNEQQLLELDPERVAAVLGLFEPDHMHFETDRAGDRAGEPSLSVMTARALDILERDPDGFFLMVEAARIDHGHHLGSAYRALTETIEFSNAVRVVLERTREEETLVLVTADHGHVFTIAGYPTRGNAILGKVVANDRTGVPADDYARDAHGLPYTTLGYHNGPGFAAERPDLRETDTADPSYRQEAAVPLVSETHSGEDVAVYAGGPGAHLVHGVQEQSYFYYAIVEALGWRREPSFFERLFK